METATSTTVQELEGKYLTFSLDDEEYGIEITRVVEIIGIMSFTSLPQTPAYIKGVINLRGKVIPIVDLRLKFGMEERQHTDETCIIVIEFTQDGSRIQLGMIVDSVSEVLNVGADELEETPKFGIALNTEFILAMAKGNGVVRTLLDVDKVLSNDDIGAFAANTP